MTDINLDPRTIALVCYVLRVEANRLERVALKGKNAAMARSQLRELNQALAVLSEAAHAE